MADVCQKLFSTPTPASEMHVAAGEPMIALINDTTQNENRVDPFATVAWVDGAPGEEEVNSLKCGDAWTFQNAEMWSKIRTMNDLRARIQTLRQLTQREPGPREALDRITQKADEQLGEAITQARKRFGHIDDLVGHAADPKTHLLRPTHYNYFFRVLFQGSVEEVCDALTLSRLQGAYQMAVQALIDSGKWTMLGAVDGISVLFRGKQIVHIVPHPSMIRGDQALTSKISSIYSHTNFTSQTPVGGDIILFVQTTHPPKDLLRVQRWHNSHHNSRSFCPILLHENGDLPKMKECLVLNGTNKYAFTQQLLQSIDTMRVEHSLAGEVKQEHDHDTDVRVLKTKLSAAEARLLYRNRDSLLSGSNYERLPGHFKTVLNGKDTYMPAFFNRTTLEVCHGWPEQTVSPRALAHAHVVMKDAGSVCPKRLFLPDPLALLVEADLRGWTWKDPMHTWGARSISLNGWLTGLQERIADQPILLRQKSTGNPVEDRSSMLQKIFEIISSLSRTAHKGKERPASPELAQRVRAPSRPQPPQSFCNHGVVDEWSKAYRNILSNISSSLVEGKDEIQTEAKLNIQGSLKALGDADTLHLSLNNANLQDVRDIVEVDLMESDVRERINNVNSIDFRNNNIVSFPIKHTNQPETKAFKEAMRLTHMPKLRTLDVSGNGMHSLYGLSSISIVALVLSNNSLVRLPRLNLPHLEILDLSRNRFSGRIDFALGLTDMHADTTVIKHKRYRSFKMLETLDISGNLFDWQKDQITLNATIMSRCLPKLQNLMVHENPFLVGKFVARREMVYLRSLFATELPLLRAFSPPRSSASAISERLRLVHDELYARVWYKPRKEDPVHDVEERHQPWRGVFFSNRKDCMPSSSAGIPYIENGAVNTWTPDAGKSTRPSEESIQTLVTAEEYSICLHSQSILKRQIELARARMFTLRSARLSMERTCGSLVVERPFESLTARFDRLNVRRAFDTLYRHNGKPSELRSLLKKISLVRLMKILERLNFLITKEERDETFIRTKLKAALCTWKTVDRKLQCCRELIGWSFSSSLFSRERAAWTCLRIFKRRKLSLLGSAMRNLQYGVAVDALEEKQKNKAATIRRINETKRTTKEIRKRTSTMMHTFRKKFNDKAVVMEKLLEERDILESLRRDTEIMRCKYNQCHTMTEYFENVSNQCCLSFFHFFIFFTVKADELARKLRDWRPETRTSDFLHYEDLSQSKPDAVVFL